MAAAWPGRLGRGRGVRLVTGRLVCAHRRSGSSVFLVSPRRRAVRLSLSACTCPLTALTLTLTLTLTPNPNLPLDRALGEGVGAVGPLAGADVPLVLRRLGLLEVDQDGQVHRREELPVDEAVVLPAVGSAHGWPGSVDRVRVSGQREGLHVVSGRVSLAQLSPKFSPVSPRSSPPPKRSFVLTSRASSSNTKRMRRVWKIRKKPSSPKKPPTPWMIHGASTSVGPRTARAAARRKSGSSTVSAAVMTPVRATVWSFWLAATARPASWGERTVATSPCRGCAHRTRSRMLPRFIVLVGCAAQVWRGMKHADALSNKSGMHPKGPRAKPPKTAARRGSKTQLVRRLQLKA